MLEKQVEQHLANRVAAAGGHAYKFVSPGRISVPDRLCLLPVPPAHQEIVARYVRFAEVKRPGGKPTEAQLREHARLRALGYTVLVLDRKGEIDGHFPGNHSKD